MQSLGGQDMRLDPPVERHERERSRADLVGERRQAQRHAFAGEALGLAVERLVLAVLLEQQHGEEAGAGPATRHDMEGRRWLRDRLAVPAGELLAHRLDDLPLARDHLQRLGHVLAELRQPRTAAGRARARRGNDDALARQMLGKRLPRRPLALEGGDTRRLLGRHLGGEIVLAGGGFAALRVAARADRAGGGCARRWGHTARA